MNTTSRLLDLQPKCSKEWIHWRHGERWPTSMMSSQSQIKVKRIFPIELTICPVLPEINTDEQSDQNTKSNIALNLWFDILDDENSIHWFWIRSKGLWLIQRMDFEMLFLQHNSHIERVSEWWRRCSIFDNFNQSVAAGVETSKLKCMTHYDFAEIPLS